APRGDIAGDLGVTEQRPGVVADHVDDHMRPEAGAILAKGIRIRNITKLTANPWKKVGPTTCARESARVLPLNRPTSNSSAVVRTRRMIRSISERYSVGQMRG